MASDPPEKLSSPTAKTNRLAIASLVASLIGVFGGSIIGMVLAVLAVGEIDRSEGREKGYGLAYAGAALGLLTLGLWAIGVVLILK